MPFRSKVVFDDYEIRGMFVAARFPFRTENRHSKTVEERATGSSGHFEIISAYRSPATNSMLRSRSNGVAKRSQHLLGKAIDVRLTDVPIETIRKVAYELGVGGIGFYSKSNFVHLDTGRFRTW